MTKWENSSMIPDKVHLVGSIGLDTVPEVLRTAGKLLGKRLRRMPDGEPGGRRLWISWQYPLLRANPFLQVSSRPPENATGFPLLCLANGVGPGDIRFGELGYAREARASYEDFRTARKAGDLPKSVRFQVSLPTPLAVISAFCPGRDMVVIERAYEKAMVREVKEICTAIPHKDLCLQWDVCLEMLMWDGQMKRWTPPFADLEGEILTRMKRISAPVPTAVELGIHLCYGDWEGKHFIQPLDAGRMVDLTNALVKTIAHPLAYVHLPVPIDRTDDAFFRPLHALKLRPGTELYLGVVHAADGVEGVKKRIAAASPYVTGFGIATECGMARARKPDVVQSLLKIHAAGSQEPRRAARKS
jgi:methionine synthase II (cobalamin-independent)